jgi:hypothetical protein
VDWEAAFLNDRYADLVVVGNQLIENEAEEEGFLQTYFGARPSAYQRARFHVMQQLSHLFYAMAFLFQGSLGGLIEQHGALPEYGDYQRRFWSGDADLVSSADKVLYGQLHWQRLLSNVSQPRYQGALKLVSERN